MGIAAVMVAALAAGPTESAEGGWRGAVALGAGLSYDGVVGLRLEGGYGPFSLSLGLGRDTLPSDKRAPGFSPAQVHANAFHSMAASLRWLSGGRTGLALSLTLWAQWERTTAATLDPSHPDDRYVVLQPAVGWRGLLGPVFLEASIGLPYTWQRFSDVSDEASFQGYTVRRRGFGWTGCGHCDLMPWLPTLEAGAGLSF
jgi:hypothetical protein